MSKGSVVPVKSALSGGTVLEKPEDPIDFQKTLDEWRDKCPRLVSQYEGLTATALYYRWWRTFVSFQLWANRPEVVIHFKATEET